MIFEGGWGLALQCPKRDSNDVWTETYRIIVAAFVHKLHIQMNGMETARAFSQQNSRIK